MPKKKLLLFVDWYEPGFKAGGPIQSCRNLVAALRNDFDISIVTGDRDLGDDRPYPGFRTDAWTATPGGERIWYASPGNPNWSNLRALIDEAAPDAIYLNSLYSFRFTILPLWVNRPRARRRKIILAPRGMLQAGAMQFKPVKKKVFIRTLRAAGVDRQIVFQATDAQEAADVARWFPASEVAVVRNFPKFDAGPPAPVKKEPGELRLVYFSRIVPKKNLLYLLDLLPRLGPDTRIQLDVCGGIEDEDYWRACRKRIDAYPDHITVTYISPVPNREVPALLAPAHVFVLPTRGENFGHAIFEALAAGKPVLLSDRTPWLGLVAKQAGWDIPLDRPEDFLQALREAAAFDQAAYDAWSRGAGALAQAYFDSLDLLNDYKKLFS